jgi:hypothetical protein
VSLALRRARLMVLSLLSCGARSSPAFPLLTAQGQLGPEARVAPASKYMRRGKKAACWPLQQTDHSNCITVQSATDSTFALH